jgi:hypothetical protein
MPPSLRGGRSRGMGGRCPAGGLDDRGFCLRTLWRGVCITSCAPALRYLPPRPNDAILPSWPCRWGAEIPPLTHPVQCPFRNAVISVPRGATPPPTAFSPVPKRRHFALVSQYRWEVEIPLGTSLEFPAGEDPGNRRFPGSAGGLYRLVPKGISAPQQVFANKSQNGVVFLYFF